jgi:hypothetical protein
VVTCCIGRRSGVLHDEVRDRETIDWKYMVLALVPQNRN